MLDGNLAKTLAWKAITIDVPDTLFGQRVPRRDDTWEPTNAPIHCFELMDP